MSINRTIYASTAYHSKKRTEETRESLAIKKGTDQRRVIRRCMKCDKVFIATGHNYRCMSCKEQARDIELWYSI